tara:strand:- start:1984 stop:2421 length:438 start_codon:yes stop_codon:yes gene_type:complete
MYTRNQKSLLNRNDSRTSMSKKCFYFILVLITGAIVVPVQIVKSEEIYFKCTGKFEINRGELIKPDWETSYIKINQDRSKSYIDDKGIKKQGKTYIRHNSYTVIHRDKKNTITTRYKINKKHGNYIVDYPQSNKTLIGTCQIGRG